MVDQKAWTVARPVVDVSAKCVNCHSACDKWTSHGGVSLARTEMEQKLPGYGGETIGCATCHNPHLDSDPGDPGRSLKYLRIGNLRRELCLNCHGSDGDSDGEVVVHTPPDKVIVYDSYVPLMGKAPNRDGQELEVSINGEPFRLRVEKGVFHTRLRVFEGVNRITIHSRGRSLWEGEVFLSAAESRAEGYDRAYYNHQTDSMDKCLACHGGEEGSFRAAVDPSPGLCYRCHEPLNRKKFLHGPLAVGECMSCHDPHGGYGPKHLRAEETELCLSCHDSVEVRGHRGWASSVGGGSCSDCHDPHQSDTRFLTREARLDALP